MLLPTAMRADSRRAGIFRNLFTQRGQALHKRVDGPGFEMRDGLRVERALSLFCDRLGWVGAKSLPAAH